MKLLLDTHVLLWWLADDRRLQPGWREALGSPDSLVMVSAASIWEMAIKIAIGKLAIDPETDSSSGSDELAKLLDRCGFVELPVTAAHAAGVARLPLFHADPFDRLLIAQARIEQLTIATADQAFAAYDVETLPGA